MRYSIEPMRLEDISQVLAVERQCFPTAWPADAYRRELLENKIARYLVARLMEDQATEETMSREGSGVSPPDPIGCQSSSLTPLWKSWTSSLKQRLSPEERPLLPTARGLIVGFAGIWLMIDEVHLTTMAVRNGHRHQGIGELLLISLIESSSQKGAHAVTLEVRASNIAAQSLYKKYGFAKAGLRQGYYSDNKEDALIMTAERITSAPFQARFQRLRQVHTERWEQNGLAKGELEYNVGGMI